MPQIKVNEIDQSIYTRVVSDDKVRIMVPGIASFGPGVSSDLTDLSGVTFTDVNDFDKVFGYTEPEYSPFKNDVSRIYAKQLIKRGAAVTFVKINHGTEAQYDIGDVTVSNNTVRGITEAASRAGSTFTLTEKAPADWATTYTHYFTKEGSTYLKVTGSAAPEWTANKYYANSDSNYNADIHMFADQIVSIKAKYDGSFGNHLLVTFTPVESSNRSFTYQYSMVTVYRADIIVDSKISSTGSVTNTPKVVGVHKLESHLVSTNPDNINYFDNDDLFNYIRIEASDTAREELSLVWSDLSANSVANTSVYSGFPEIPLRYFDENGNSTYNAAALLTRGTDFIFNCKLDETTDYTTQLREALVQGFGGFDYGVNNKMTKENVNRWTYACYNDIGVVPTILTALKNCYENYVDPYVYDFDFITSGGFIDETFTMYNGSTKATKQDITQALADNASFLLSVDSNRDRVDIPETVLSIHQAMLNLVEARQDCIALFDMGPKWDKNTLTDYVMLVNTSYGAFHAPWCYCNNPNVVGTVLMPPSFVFLYTMLSNLINNTDAQKWFPPAGVTRATARVVVKPLYEIGSVTLDKWQNNTLARVNPIMKLKNYGYVIYGQYTAYVAQDEYTHSALESLNVRLISNCVKKQIFNTCLKLTFEPNNSSLWMKFYDAMDKYLLFMKRNDGVYDYRIQMDEGTVTTDDINELRCPGKVWINPVRAAEFFDIDFILTEAGVTFTDTVEEGV